MIYCTVTTNAHLKLAQVMAESVKNFNPDATIVICIVEEDVPIAAEQFHAFDEVVLAKDLGFPNFYRHIFKHTAVEACTSVKGRLLQYVWEQYPNEEKMIYLDGDVRVYGRFDEVDELLNTHTLLMTPHILHQEQKKREVKRKELLLMKFGIYNLGFLALRKSDNARHFLDWWMKRLEMYCYIDVKNQIFTDQKWLDYAPAFFDTHVLKHPGYNVAWWNLNHRKLEETPTGKWMVNGEPLRFFHYSGILRVKGDYTPLFERFVPGRNEDAHKLIMQYVQELQLAGEDFAKKEPWSYNFFYSGKPILLASRKVFRTKVKKYSQIINPFLYSNKTFSVVQKPIPAAKRKGLSNRVIKFRAGRRRINR